MIGTLLALEILPYLIFLSGYTIMPTSHMKNQGAGRCKSLAWDNTARKWQCLELNPGIQDPKALTNAVSLEPPD